MKATAKVLYCVETESGEKFIADNSNAVIAQAAAAHPGIDIDMGGGVHLVAAHPSEITLKDGQVPLGQVRVNLNGDGVFEPIDGGKITVDA